MSAFVGILGCGWLGHALAVHLLRRGGRVRGSTTTATKLERLHEAGIEPHLLDLTDLGSAAATAAWARFLECQTLVVNVPPSRAKVSPREDMTRLRSFLLNSPVDHLVYVSSTSVFGDGQGEVDETTPPHPETESGKKLLDVETYLLDEVASAKCRVSILRPGGLIGPGRHPARFMSGRKAVEGGERPVNLVHRADVVGILASILATPGSSAIQHAVADEHPRRRDLYTRAAEFAGLPAPQFSSDQISSDQAGSKIHSSETPPSSSKSPQAAAKIVHAPRVKTELKYSLQYPSPLEALARSEAWSEEMS